MMMKQREFNLDKKKNFSEWYNTIIYSSELADIRYNVRGFVIYRPWAALAFRNLYNLFHEELEKDGHLPVIFPTVIPEENFKKEKEHVEGFAPEVLWVTKQGNEEMERPLALRPTSETAFYQMYKLWVDSFADLPLKLYQSCSVFRFEKETNPFLRGIEFLWIETHDIFRTQKEAEEQVMSDGKTLDTIIRKKLGIDFLFFDRPQWDKFAGAQKTFAADCILPDGKVLQFGTTHLLGQNFTKAFDVKYSDEEGNSHYPFGICFGPGIGRMVAAVVSVHGDEKGLIMPFEIAPVQIVIVPIVKTGGNEKAVLEKCKEIEKNLKAEGIRAKVDAGNKTPGFKFNFWEMKGVPLRIEIGEREVAEKTATIAKRNDREKTKVNEGEIAAKVREIAERMLNQMREKSKEELQSAIKTAKTKEEVKKILDEKGIAKVSFCSTEMDGKECADTLKDYTKGGKVRGTLVGKEEKADGNCVICGKSAKKTVYVARQY